MMQKIYIGPTIPGVVTNGTIFKDKLPEHIEKKAEENKNIARLIIPIGDVLEAKKRLNIEGSVEYAAYKNLQSRKGVNNEDI